MNFIKSPLTSEAGLPPGFLLAIAIAAIDWTILLGLEGDLSLFATLCAGNREHLTGPASASGPFLPLGRPTIRAALGFVHEPSALVELLLALGERERFAAITAC